MNQERDGERPKRQSARLSTYNYTSTGAYFVTICVDHRRPLFLQPDLHQCLVKTWQGLPDRFPSITLDEFVIMPDHVHFILWLQRSSKDGPSLGGIVGAYKSLTTVAWLKYHKVRGLRCDGHLWQRGYYEHVIRNDQDLELTRQYIVDNPAKRQEDYPLGQTYTE